MPTPRSLAELYNWLQSVLPLTWDAAKRLVGLPGSLKFPDGTTQATAYTGGGGSGGVTGSGTTGSIPKWNGTAALADSGASMDGNNRLAVPIGIAFPGGSTLDAAPVTISGSGAANEIAYWSSSTGIAGSANLTYVPASGNLTSLGTIAAKKLQITDITNPDLLDSGGNGRIRLALGQSVYTANVGAGGTAHAVEAPNVGDSGRIAMFRVGGVEKASFMGSGKLVQTFTDSSATPGAVTINKPSGKSAIAAGASSVVITNSVVTASSEVLVTAMDLDGTLTSYKAISAAGSFTVTGNANATAAWRFQWWVLN